MNSTPQSSRLLALALAFLASCSGGDDGASGSQSSGDASSTTQASTSATTQASTSEASTSSGGASDAGTSGSSEASSSAGSTDTAPDSTSDTATSTSSDTTSASTSTTGAIEDCDALLSAFWAEVTEIRACKEDNECGQVLTGTSCGCTRNWVARLDADATEFLALVELAGELRCELPFISTCDCPEADGYRCDVGTCSWNYL